MISFMAIYDYQANALDHLSTKSRTFIINNLFVIQIKTRVTTSALALFVSITTLFNLRNLIYEACYHGAMTLS